MGRRVGSNVPSVAGGVPEPLATVTGGSPPRPCAVTFHDAIVSPVGGVIVAVNGTGFVTIVPSAGLSAVIVGGGPAAATVIVKLGLTAFGPDPLLALTVNVNAPTVVVVPDSTPLTGSRLNPPGSDPDANPNVGAGTPLAANA